MPGQHKYVAINRKTAAHLQRYAASFRGPLIFLSTTAPVVEPLQRLRNQLRQQIPPEQFVDSVASPRMPEPNPSVLAVLSSAAVAAAAAASGV